MLYLGADHRGFKLKEQIKKYFDGKKISYKDMGAFVYDKDDDYPDFAYLVAKNVATDKKNGKGIVICGSGIGANITANKVRGARAALLWSKKAAEAATEDDSPNIISLPADFISFNLAKEIIETWLKSGGNKLAARHKRRLKKIKAIENKQ